VNQLSFESSLTNHPKTAGTKASARSENHRAKADGTEKEKHPLILKLVPSINKILYSFVIGRSNHFNALSS